MTIAELPFGAMCVVVGYHLCAITIAVWDQYPCWCGPVQTSEEDLNRSY